MKPAGRDLCFTMSVVDEYELVTDRVDRIHSIYPDAQVVLLVDAPVGAATSDWVESPGLQIIHSQEHLYAVENGGRVVQAHLDAFLRTSARWWFKFDPDTVIRRPFSALPDTPMLLRNGSRRCAGPLAPGRLHRRQSRRRPVPRRQPPAALAGARRLRADVGSREWEPPGPGQGWARELRLHSRLGMSTTGHSALPGTPRFARSGSSRRGTPGSTPSRIRTSCSTSTPNSASRTRGARSRGELSSWWRSAFRHMPTSESSARAMTT